MTGYMIRSLPGSLALPLHAIYKCQTPLQATLSILKPPLLHCYYAYGTAI